MDTATGVDTNIEGDMLTVLCNPSSEKGFLLFLYPLFNFSLKIYKIEKRKPMFPIFIFVFINHYMS